MNDVLQQASDGNAACLIIFLYEGLIAKIPQRTIEFANELAFPLFAGTWNIRFAELIRDISSLILTDQYGESVMNEMLEMLLFKQKALPKELASALVEKYRLDGRHRVLLAQCRGTAGDERCRVEPRVQVQINNMLIQEFRLFFATSAYVNQVNRVIFLVEAKPLSQLKQFLHELQEKTQRYDPRARLVFGVGNTYDDFTLLSRSCLEAEKAINFNSADGITAFADLGIYQLLMEVPDEGLVRGYAVERLSALIDYDRKYQKDLLRTLEIYLETNCNVIRTAQLTYVHRNTLASKLKKIRELLGMSIEEADVRNHLYNCLKIYRYSGS